MRPLEEIRETAPQSDPLAARHFGSVPSQSTDAGPSALAGHFGSGRPSFLDDRGRSLAFLEVDGTASQRQPASKPPQRRNWSNGGRIDWDTIIFERSRASTVNATSQSSSCASPVRAREAEAYRSPGHITFFFFFSFFCGISHL